MINLLIFDWGDTIMIDYALEGPMYLWDQNSWIPGAEKSLSRISTQYRMVIATNAPHSGTQEMIKALERVGASTYFSSFFSSRELGYGKPDPRFFSTIAKKENVSPAECIMIGDRYKKDIKGAKEAGMQTIFFNEKKQPGSFDQADRVINHMNDLEVAIHSLVAEH